MRIIDGVVRRAYVLRCSASIERPGRVRARSVDPASSLPFWDLQATIAAIDRCASNGHKDIVFTQDPSFFGLPELTDRYWDPMWASA